MLFPSRSSIPGHEYLEADYECAPGYYMVSTTTRLLCKNRQWIGQLPKCKIKANFEGACIEASCDHICKDIDGRPVCSCYKGFQVDGDKCIGKLCYQLFACCHLNTIQLVCGYLWKFIFFFFFFFGRNVLRRKNWNLNEEMWNLFFKQSILSLLFHIFYIF